MNGKEGVSEAMDILEIGHDTPETYQPLLSIRTNTNNDTDKEELRLAPLIWWDVKDHLDKELSASGRLQQYAVLGHVPSDTRESKPHKPVLLNSNAPWSAFLCGSQGSGKSHTLSCMLEGCLLTEPRLGKNPNPLAGLVLHYDGSRGGDVCEAAYLCTKVPTTVLVSASNYGNLKLRYEDMAKKEGGVIKVEQLLIAPKQLDTERVKTLMAVPSDGEAPLYIQTLVKIIREIAIESGGIGTFDYTTLKKKLNEQVFSGQQNQPLSLRIELLESFLDLPVESKSGKHHIQSATSHRPHRDYLVGKPGELVIVDLTDPVVDVDSACVLFDTCLSIFTAQTTGGKIIALDEAHNYLLQKNAAAEQFTGKLLKTIREQRHQGSRIVIATQEPTLDTALLDLCSIIMVHRCTSPAWYEVLKKHVAGLYLGTIVEEEDAKVETGKMRDRALFRQIVKLKLGESLLFCPAAAIGVQDEEIERMLDHFVKFQTRERITADGGRTRLAEDA